MRLLAGRRDELAHLRVQIVNRLHRLLTELIPGGAGKKDLSSAQARRMLAGVRPRDPAGATRRRLALDLIGDLETVDVKLTALTAELRVAFRRNGSTLMDLYGIGPAGAARILVDVATVTRFPAKGHFASWNGTAPLEASSGEQVRHRLSRAGDRRINHVLHIMAIVQLRNDTAGRAYYRRKVAAGKTPMEALRALKRRLSDVVYRQLVADALAVQSAGREADPGGHVGARTESSADDLATPMVVSSDTSLPGPATTHDRPAPLEDTPDELDSDVGDDPAGQERRAVAGAGPSLPLIALARARRGSPVQSGPQGRRTATRSALDGGGASPYPRGAGDPRAADSNNTGGEAATDQDPPPGPTNEAPTNPLTLGAA